MHFGRRPTFNTDEPRNLIFLGRTQTIAPVVEVEFSGAVEYGALAGTPATTREELERLATGVTLGDCDFNGSLDAFDLRCVTTTGELEAVRGELGSPPGDLDGNGAVEFSDFLTFSTNFGQAGSYADGGMDLDGTVGFTDFLVLSATLGNHRGNFSSPRTLYNFICFGRTVCSADSCFQSIVKSLSFAPWEERPATCLPRLH